MRLQLELVELVEQTHLELELMEVIQFLLDLQLLHQQEVVVEHHLHLIQTVEMEDLVVALEEKEPTPTMEVLEILLLQIRLKEMMEVIVYQDPQQVMLEAVEQQQLEVQLQVKVVALVVRVHLIQF